MLRGWKANGILFFTIMKRIAIIFMAAASILCIMTGCHSSKKAETPVVPNQSVEVIESGNDDWSFLSKRLGVSLDKKKDKAYIRLYSEVEKWLGTPYRYGGSTKTGCDCSGFVSQVYKAVYGISLQRNSASMRDKDCRNIRREELRTGDLVFFKTGSASRINHVGIYLKEGKFIHASSSKGVIVSDMNERYYQRTYSCSGRVN